MNQKEIAVVGSGISGLSTAWALAERHRVTLFEAEDRIGGHSNTIEVEAPDGRIAIDTGFIVYNENNYPNLTALFDHLEVPTAPSNMSFALTLDDGAYEYAGSAAGFFDQPQNLIRRRHWQLFGDMRRFFKTAGAAVLNYPDGHSLGAFLEDERYGDAFIQDHILPMGAAIWSSDISEMMGFPARTFVDFYANHGLLRMTGQPRWRTVEGGSREYVRRLIADRPLNVLTQTPVVQVSRRGGKVWVGGKDGLDRAFDDVVLATHADTSLSLIDAPSPDEEMLLSAFNFQKNTAVLHRDTRQMPRRRRLWSAWNYLKTGVNSSNLSVTYWMNRLQPLPTTHDYFVTLNPVTEIDPSLIEATIDYQHPIFSADAVAAQRHLWSLQGRDGLWHAGAWFGYGFHEDGLQAGLAVAEQLGGVVRPWTVANPSGRIATDLPYVAEAAE